MTQTQKQHGIIIMLFSLLVVLFATLVNVIFTEPPTDISIVVPIVRVLAPDQMELVRPKREDDLEFLFDRFDFPKRLREFFRAICIVQNVDPILAVSLVQIESNCGNHPGYISMSEDRMYLTKGVPTWDLGIFQMSSYYADYYEELFYNPVLIEMLGYTCYAFDLRNDLCSIQVGVAYLGYLIKYYNGNTDLAVKTYNTGYVNVRNNTIPEHTQRYSFAIHRSWSSIWGDA